MLEPTGGRQLENAGERVREAAGDVAQRGITDFQALMDFQLLKVSGMTITLGGLVAAALALLAALFVSLLLRRALRRYGDAHSNANQAALYTVSRLVHYLLLAVGLLIALDLAGVPLGKFALFAGALGVGIGFGLQAIFSNFISGLILLFDRSLKIGDFVELDTELRGTVRAINIRATRITTNDSIDVLVPNSEFVTGRVVNWTHGSVNRRIRVPFSVAYGVDKELVKKAALEAAANVPFTLSMDGRHQPQVWLVGFGDSAVDFVLAVWLNEDAARRSAAIRAAYLWELDTALKKYCVEIPFPQRDLHVRSLFGIEGEAAFAALRGAPSKRPAGEEAQAAQLAPGERMELARNDARVDAEHGIREEEAARRAEQAGGEPER